MTDRDSSGFTKSPAKQWLLFATVLIVIGAGAYFTVDGQGGSDVMRATPDTATPDGFTDVVLPVQGMSCGACAASVKRTLKDIDGVADVEVGLAERHVRVRYANEKLTSQHLAAAINKLGYKATVPAQIVTEVPHVEVSGETRAEQLQTTTVRIPVDGMACKYCAQSVEETLADIAGVKDVKISIEEKEARVQYVEGAVTTERLIEAIDAQGFTAGTPIGGGD